MDDDVLDFLEELRAGHEKEVEREQNNQENQKTEIERKNGFFVQAENNHSTELEVKNANCDHIELFHQICLNCNEFLHDNQITNISQKIQREKEQKEEEEFDLDGSDDADDEFIEYREYALLGRGKGHLIRSDHSKQFIQREIDALFKNRRLVLVLDLDSTLIHTADIGQDRRMDRKMSFSIYDKNLALYSAKMYPFRYLVKCRPYLTEFMLELLPKYQVFFYTAGIRIYGEMIVKIMKQHILD